MNRMAIEMGRNLGNSVKLIITAYVHFKRRDYIGTMNR